MLSPRCHRELQPLLDGMLAVVPAERRPSVLSSLVDFGDNSLLHIAVARAQPALARTLLGMVSGHAGRDAWCRGGGAFFTCGGCLNCST